MNRLALPFLSVGAALLSTVSAQAAALTVEEFDAMTRVTIPALEEGEWTVNRSVRAFDMRIGSVDLGMTDPVLPDESRLSAVEVWEGKTDTGISIRFTCDCTTSHFDGEGGVTIVDIARRIPPVGADYAQVLGQVDGSAPTSLSPISVTQGWNPSITKP